MAKKNVPPHLPVAVTQLRHSKLSSTGSNYVTPPTSAPTTSVTISAQVSLTQNQHHFYELMKAAGCKMDPNLARICYDLLDQGVAPESLAHTCVELDKMRKAKLDNANLGKVNIAEQPLTAFQLLNEFRQSRFLTDVTIEVEGRQFSAHRCVLAAGVPYFRSMFASNMLEASMQTVVIQDIAATAFEQLLQYAYTGSVDIALASVQPLLYAASILQVDAVCRACEQFLQQHLAPANCLQLRQFAQMHNCEQLVAAVDNFTLDHFPEVRTLPDFNSISVEHLCTLLGSDELRVSDEADVLTAVLHWAEHRPPADNVAQLQPGGRVTLHQVPTENQPGARARQLVKLLPLVRLTQLPLKLLVHTLNNNQMIKEEPACRELILSAMCNKVCQQQSDDLSADMAAGTADTGVAALGGADSAECSTVAADRLDGPAQQMALGVCLDVARPRKATAGVIFCVGGRGTSGDPFRSVEAFDWRRDRWLPVAEMTVRRRHVGVVSAHGKLYAIGGHDGQQHLDSGECLEPRRNAWTPVARMHQRRRGIAVGALCNAIYAVGGLDDTTCFHTVERYDMQADEWSNVAGMNVQRGGVGVAALLAHLYAVGGNDGTTSLDSSEKYDPHLNKWTLVAPMAHRRAGSGVTQLEGSLYAIGGFDDNAPLATCERYDPRDNSWHMLPPMSCPRGGVGVASLGGRVYAVGGHDGKCYLDTVEAFEPRAHAWLPVTPIGQCRAGAGVAHCMTSVESLSAGAAGFVSSAPANSGGGVAYCV